MAASHWLALSVAEMVATEEGNIENQITISKKGLTENAEDDSLESEPTPG